MHGSNFISIFLQLYVSIIFWGKSFFRNGKPMGKHERKFPIDSILSFRILDVESATKHKKVRIENSFFWKEFGTRRGYS